MLLFAGNTHLHSTADILTALGRTNEALQTYQDLLKQNSDNLAYYRGYFKTKGVDIGKNFLLFLLMRL